MTIAELPDGMRMLEETEDTEIDGRKVAPGYLLVSDRWEVMRHVSKEALAGLTVTMLEDVMCGGKDVDHITRVTGYMSRTSGWNPSKVAELRDRYRGGGV